MKIADNLQHLETHYIKVWIKRWQQQMKETDCEEERAQLQDNVDKAQAEIKNRGEA